MSIVPTFQEIYQWYEGVETLNQTITSGSTSIFTIAMPSSGSCFKTIDKAMLILDAVRSTGSAGTVPQSITLQFPSGSQTEYITSLIGNFPTKLYFDITSYLNPSQYNRIVSGSINNNGPTSIFVQTIKLELLILLGE